MSTSIDELGAQLEEIKAKSCEARIESELKDRERYLDTLFTIFDDEDCTATEEERDGANDEIYEMAYGLETYKVTRLTWSGGGPADWIEVQHDGDGIRRIDYVFQDWYDGARREVSKGSPVWRYAEMMLDGLEA
jgi:leucyl-tRNA synthetase